MIRTLAVCAVALALAAPAQAQRARQRPPAEPPPPAAPGPADFRTPKAEDVLVIDTNRGRIFVEMYPQVAPNHVERVRTLARRGDYDGRKFFRVIDYFMAQTGDPLDTGEGDSDLPNLAAEFTYRRGLDDGMVMVSDSGASETGFVGAMPIMSQSSMLAALTADGKISAWGLYCPGVAGMARAQDENSANAQFFLMRQAYPSLEKRYTAWGRVIHGLDVVRAIKTGEPVEPPQDEMTRVRVLADIPAAERPKVRVVDARSAWFKAQVDQQRAEDGADFSACNLNFPATVE